MRRLRPTPANLRSYHRLVQALADDAPAILPARFGTSVADLEELRLILGFRQEGLRKNLRVVRNRVQMTVRAVPHHLRQAPDRGGRTDGTDSSGRRQRSAKQSFSGTSYLRARAMARSQIEVPEFEPVRSAVKRWIKATRVEKRGGVVSIYHLVPRGSVGAYRRAFEHAAADVDLRPRLSGPFPPYAFAEGW
jgi:hypothetical protein